MVAVPRLHTLDDAAFALEHVRVHLPQLVQAYPDLHEFLPVFKSLCLPLLARAADDTVRGFLIDELDRILVELRAWPAGQEWYAA